ncbi:MAG: TetR/AcrR family transcriptional regulator [Verrucomicrobia bacterium]|jgi:AcrR family transcriptional regulator|nr:TetR/AcrR family transcriptional regulator [Verrucomicrobiota bacterium]
MNRISESDTKTLILDAAEQAFADLGFDSASLRHIISVAGVNLAAVHYHFGSKEALIEAVFSRRLTPLNKERLKLLDQLEAEAGKSPLNVEKVIGVLIGPALRLARDPGKGGPVVMRLFGRTIAEPSEQLQKLMHGQFGDVIRRFTAAFRCALPGLPEDVLYWRIQFVIGAMAHIMCDPTGLKTMSGGLCDPNDTEKAISEMVTFLATGMRAEVSKRRKK